MTTRRGNNEGTIQCRKNGTYRAQVTLEGQRISFTGKTRRECQEWIRKMRDQIDGGLSYVGASMDLRKYMDLWMQFIKENRRPKTYLQYRDILDRYILPKFGETRLRDLQPIRIEKYLSELREKGIGDRTTQIIYGVLHAALEKAIKKGLIGRNPLDAVEKPKVRNPKKKVVLDSSQVQQFLIAADLLSRWNMIYHLAVVTGMREGEVLGLRWIDIDWRKNCLKVQQQLQRIPREGFVFGPPKTEAGARTLALGQSTINKLIDHRTKQDQDRLVAGKRWKETGLVFTTSVGTPIDPRNLLNDFKRVVAVVGLPPMRFHDLRHTNITMVLNELEAPIKEAQRRAGHTRPSTTIDIYAGEISSKYDEQVAKGLDELVTPIKVDISKRSNVNR